MQKLYISFLVLIVFQISGLAQSYWKPSTENEIRLPKKSVRYTIPEKYGTYELQLEQVKTRLSKAPAKNNTNQNVAITLPMPDGTVMEFFVFQSHVLPPKLAAKYPMIQTYLGYNQDHSAKVYLDMTTKGLHAVIDQNGKSIYIDPYAVFQDRYYISYYASDLMRTKERSAFTCGVTDEFIAQNPSPAPEYVDAQPSDLLQKSSAGDPVKLRTYKMAITCTGEYAQYHGGTIEDALSAITTKLNRLNMVFERDLAIHMELVENNDELIFLNGNTDPFTNGNTGELINQSQATIDSRIGFATYDFGHVFSQGGYAGLAQLRAACTTSKARGASTMFTPVNDAFVISIIAHEMGHQMGGNHSMSSCHNVNSGTAYEPGSGSTIMSYAGICGAENNIVGDADDYYFTWSLTEMFAFTRGNTGGGCADKTDTNNTTPDVEIPIEDGFFIPINTPFEMTVNATDDQGDHLTYAWEQLDLGPMSVPGSPDGNCPLFRSYPPSDNPTRVFPRMQTIISNNNDIAEILPPYSRDMTFRCTVRDNNIEGGGVSWDLVEFEATAEAGPFLVTNPNASIAWDVGSFVEVNWDVANTNGALVDCQAVDILLSLDGGYTYPITLYEGAVNDGSEFVLVPNEITNQARVKIKASDNIFFDISNTNFSISDATEPNYSIATTPNFFQVCLPEVVAIDINTTSLAGFDAPIELSIIGGLPADATANFSDTSINPNESGQLFIDFTNVTTEDTYEVLVQSIAPNADTIVRAIVLTTVSNNYDNLILQTPNDGDSGVSGLPTFDWQFAEDANRYSIQIATSPSFAAETIIDQANNLTATPYTPSLILEENTLYYWRVLPQNECGVGHSSKIFAFHSQSINCAKEPSFDTPVNISSSGTWTTKSEISVIPNGEISDINVASLKGNHEFFSDIRIKLESPTGTEVTLFAGKCANYNGNFDLTLDDEAPTGFSCPPNGTMQPQQPLSAFIGENTAGIWTLKIEDTVGGSGGSIQDWSLEFCADINLSNPLLIRNELMPLPPNTNRKINADFLYAEDTENADWELKYTLVENVQNGSLLLNGQVLQVGDQFNQGQVTWNQLVYQHDGSATLADHFDFTIIDGDGGWTGTHTFQIEIDENAVVSTKDALAETPFSVFPNPVSTDLTILAENLDQDLSHIQLFNTLGKQVHPTLEKINNSKAILHVKDLPRGVYIIQAQVAEKVFSQKVTVQ